MALRNGRDFGGFGTSRPQSRTNIQFPDFRVHIRHFYCVQRRHSAIREGFRIRAALLGPFKLALHPTLRTLISFFPTVASSISVKAAVDSKKTKRVIAGCARPLKTDWPFQSFRRSGLGGPNAMRLSVFTGLQRQSDAPCGLPAITTTQTQLSLP